MNKTKKITKKIVLILVILLTILMLFSVKSYAAEWEFQIGEEDDTSILDGVVGILTYGLKTLILAFLALLKTIIASILSFGGLNEQGAIITSPASIIFNRVDLLKIDFFNTNSEIPIINNLHVSIAQWYTVVRNISIIILLGILLYVGIRMAISTVAAEEAKYKKMFKDWVVSLVLVYVLQYIMIIVIEINNTIVTMLATGFGIGTGTEHGLEEVTEYLFEEAWSVSFVQSLGCTLLYGILIMMTFLFLIMYLKRLIVTAFLIIIAPLITITYSIDKMGDGKSQALNNWLKEFCYNILIQPFHCIIYGALVITTVTAMSTEKSVAVLILAIMGILFTYQAEDLVKKIFGVQPSSLGSVVAGAGFALAAMNMLKGKGKDAKGTTGKLTNSKQPEIANLGKNKINNVDTNNQQNATTNPSGGAGESGTGAGTQQTGPYSNGSAAEPSKTRRQKAASIGKDVLKSQLVGSAKLAPAVAMAMIGLGTGDIKGAVAGASLGNSMSNSVDRAYHNKIYNDDTEHNEAVMASEYLEWAKYQPEYENSDYEGLAERSSTILNANLDEVELSDSDMKYRRYMEGLQKQYEAGGESSDVAKKHVIDTIKSTQMGDIEPKAYQKERLKLAVKKKNLESTGGYSRNVQPQPEPEPQPAPQPES